MELTLITAVTVALVAFSSTVSSQQVCGSEVCETGLECYQVRVCSPDDDSFCSLQPKCIDKNWILERDKQTCFNGQQPVIRVVNFRFYTTVPCHQCMGDNSQCVGDVCCSPLPAGRSDTGEGVSPVCRPACRMGCQYGMETDAQGCPLCSCRDPCRNMTCPAGWGCQVRGAELCRGPVCSGLSASCVADPCEGVTCPDGQRCTPCTDRDSCPSTGYVCQAGESGLCSGVTCRMLCQFGKARDHNGCEMCYCARSPCEEKVCPQHEVCKVEPTPCFSGTCYTARCVPATASEVCPPVVCRMHCAFGWERDSLTGCEVCRCKKFPDVTPDLCNDNSTPKCPPGSHCEMRQIQCVKPPCLAVPVCLSTSELSTPAPATTTTGRPLEPRSDGSCPNKEIGDWKNQWCGHGYRPCPQGRTCCPSFFPSILVCKLPPSVLEDCNKVRSIFGDVNQNCL